jgi:hypothetical protein
MFSEFDPIYKTDAFLTLNDFALLSTNPTI